MAGVEGGSVSMESGLAVEKEYFDTRDVNSFDVTGGTVESFKISSTLRFPIFAIWGVT